MLAEGGGGARGNWRRRSILGGSLDDVRGMV